jgi:hypothetical protein
MVVKDNVAWVLHNVSLHPPLRWAKWPAAAVVVFPSFLFFLICDLPKEIFFVFSYLPRIEIEGLQILYGVSV